jgi:hypothetical protein
MKKILILSIMAIVFFSCKKSSTSNPNPPGGGNTIDTVGTVYAAGYSSAAFRKNIATYWRGSTAVSLSDGTKDAYATGITMIGNDVYVAGYEATGTNTAMVKYWKNGTAVNLTDGTKSAEASSIAVVGTDVYVAGYEFNAIGNPVAKYWKNGVAVNLTDGTKYASAKAITISGTDVYVAGYEYIASGASIAKYWKNGTAINLSDGTAIHYANSIALNGNDVHVAGLVFALAITEQAYWKNAVLTTLPAVLNAETNSVVVSQGNVYVGGSDGGKAVYWKDAVKNPLSNNLSATEHVTSIFVFAGKVYCGGYRDFLGAGNFAATVWSFGSSTDLNTATQSQVKSIYVVN